MIAAEAELGIENVITNECERKATHGDKLSMHYRGTLADTGKQFDASYCGFEKYVIFVKFRG